MKFGDLVTDTQFGGIYMYIAPYIGPRGTSDPEGPASWHADIDNDFTQSGENAPSVTWSVDEKTDLLDE